jgi:hypothetical protein
MAPRIPVATVALALLVAFAAPPAGATAARGTTTIDLDGGAVRALRAQGATITAGRPARIVRSQLRLPVRDGFVGSTATINFDGSLTLRHGKRSLRIERLQARLGRSVRIAATVRGARLTLFTAGRRSSLDAAVGTASLRNAPLKMTRAAATVVKRALKLRRLPVGGVGRATVDAVVTATAKAPATSGQPGSPSAPPQSAPITDELPLLARPASAVDVTSATVTWHVRDSWVRYISAGSGSSPIGSAIAGAAIPPEQHPCSDSPGSAPPLVYSYTLPFVRGWHDAASGRTALYSSGGVRFLFPAHGIDLEVNDLEIELNGSASRVIARFDGRQSTNPGNKRAVLVDLANAGPAPGQTATVRGTLPTSGSLDVFAGFYPAHAGFGCVTVSYAS